MSGAIISSTYVDGEFSAYCPKHGAVDLRRDLTKPEAAVLRDRHNKAEHFAEVREKLISEHGAPRLRSVYRAVCDDCHWITGAWATPASAAREVRKHNSVEHYWYGEARMKINEEKAEKMRTKFEVDNAIEVAEARLAALLQERARLDKLPAEPAGNGTIVRFPIQFDEHGPTYDYAAIRANSLWWLTGKESRGRTWSELLEFASQDWRIAGGERQLRMSVFHTGTGDVLKGAK